MNCSGFCLASDMDEARRIIRGIQDYGGDLEPTRISRATADCIADYDYEGSADGMKISAGQLMVFAYGDLRRMERFASAHGYDIGFFPTDDCPIEDLEEITSDWALWDANEGHPVPCYYSSLEDLLDASEDMIIAQGQHSAWSAGYRFEVVRYNHDTMQHDYIGKVYAVGDSVIFVQD